MLTNYSIRSDPKPWIFAQH